MKWLNKASQLYELGFIQYDKRAWNVFIAVPLPVLREDNNHNNNVGEIKMELWDEGEEREPSVGAQCDETVAV